MAGKKTKELQRSAESLRKRTGAYHHGDLRRVLLDATLALAAERGAAGFSLAEICRAAGVSQAAPYRHFESKEHILFAAGLEGFAALEQAIGAALLDSADIFATTEALARAYLAFAKQHPAHLAIMFGHPDGGHFGNALDDPRCSGPEGYRYLPPASNATEEALLACWEAGHRSFLAFASALANAARGSPLEEAASSNGGRDFAAAAWAMLHGVAVLWLEKSIPAEWGDHDFQRVIDWLIRPWLKGLSKRSG